MVDTWGLEGWGQGRHLTGYNGAQSSQGVLC